VSRNLVNEGKGLNAGISLIQQNFMAFCLVAGALLDTADAKMDKIQSLPRGSGKANSCLVVSPLAFLGGR
jgi:hypothetical protein